MTRLTIVAAYGSPDGKEARRRALREVSEQTGTAGLAPWIKIRPVVWDVRRTCRDLRLLNRERPLPMLWPWKSGVVVTAGR
jgi:hypothetical protein